MAQDLNQAMNRLQEMLSTEDGKQDLQNLISSFGGIPGDNNDGVIEPSSDNAGDNANLGNLLPGGMNLAMLGKIQGIVGELQSGNDSRSNLLYALQPYLGKGRAGYIGNAAKLMSLGKLPDLLKRLRG